MEPKVSAVNSCSPKDRILIMEIGDSHGKLTRRAGPGMSLSLRACQRSHGRRWCRTKFQDIPFLSSGYQLRAKIAKALSFSVCP